MSASLKDKSVVLHIDASPRGGESFSRRAADVFLRDLQHRQPDLVVDRLSLWNETLPDFSADALAAKYAVLGKREHRSNEARAWNCIRRLIMRLDDSAKIVLSTPMWNLSVPYPLKHYIDLITQPGLSFRFEPGLGYTPLLRDRPVMVIVASAGDFSLGTDWGRPDLASTYLKQALRFIGLASSQCVAVGPTAGEPALIEAAEQRAHAKLRAAAGTF
ncbi:FMN-dependent NADH-azoreductase [Pollutimonas thiosulfatoxidans]|nr:NAD(P)H-dependent oxidoreductase [Pollutimonas thiosulfatoxidans]